MHSNSLSKIGVCNKTYNGIACKKVNSNASHAVLEINC